MAAIKLNMSKAYDRLEWSFLRSMTSKMGFNEGWIKLIMKCVSTVTYQIKVNSEYITRIHLQHGPREGDPLSPYLFLSCAEGLSAMLQMAKANEKIKGFCICRGAPRVNHLFFADDSLILMQSIYNDAFELRHIMSIHERVCEQVINKDKSSILFSPNSETRVKRHIRGILGITQEAKKEKYLGLPVSIGKTCKKAFEYIKGKLWARIRGWQEKLLSKAEKEILVEAVAQVIPTYAMSCFDLTKRLCDELSTIIGRYWWSQQDNTHKIHWLS